MPGGKLRIFLATETSAGVRVIRSLMQRGHDVVGVLTGTDSADRSVARFARDAGIAVHGRDHARDPAFAAIILKGEADLLFTVRFPLLIDAQVAAAPKLGAFNLHTGPLPRYAGWNVASWAIYHGEQHHGVTLHRLEREVDRGAIAGMATFPIDPGDTGLSLTAKCLDRGNDLLLRLVESVAHGLPIQLASQETSGRCYFGKTPPQRGFIDWRLPARRVVDHVRACDYYPFVSPWPSPLAVLNDVRIGICKAGLTDTPCHEAPGSVRFVRETALVATSDRWIELAMLHCRGTYATPGELLKDGDRFSPGPPAEV